jgi:hypothetical protein
MKTLETLEEDEATMKWPKSVWKQLTIWMRKILKVKFKKAEQN